VPLRVFQEPPSFCNSRRSSLELVFFPAGVPQAIDIQKSFPMVQPVTSRSSSACHSLISLAIREPSNCGAASPPPIKYLGIGKSCFSNHQHKGIGFHPLSHSFRPTLGNCFKLYLLCLIIFALFYLIPNDTTKFWFPFTTRARKISICM
jgi:hypothetical protein